MRRFSSAILLKVHRGTRQDRPAQIAHNVVPVLLKQTRRAGTSLYRTAPDGTPLWVAPGVYRVTLTPRHDGRNRCRGDPLRAIVKTCG
jgi:hypothetical protein